MKRYTLDIVVDSVLIVCYHKSVFYVDGNINLQMTWDDLMENLSCVHMGEWKTKYNDPGTLDGTQWSVDIEYDNEIAPKHYWGSNKFPYNFERFLELMEMV